MSRKRIVFYTENYAYGGLERFLFDAISSAPSGWDVCLIHNDHPGFAERLAARVDRPLRRLSLPIAPSSPFFDRLGRRLPRLAASAPARWAARAVTRRSLDQSRLLIRAALKSVGPADVIHIVNGGYPGALSCAAAAAAAAEHGIPRRVYSILSVHDPLFAPAPEPSVERDLLANVGVFVVNCEAARQALLGHRGFPAARVVTIHTGIPAPAPDAAVALRLRERWLGDGDMLVGCLGALYPLKGHRYLIEALSAALERAPGLRLVLVGDGKSAGELKALARSLSVEKSISFPGYHEGDSADALAAFDVLAHPTSQTEGLPYAILEAMALGKAIVATSVGGVPEAVSDGETGLLVPPANAPALADALTALARDPGLGRRLGDAARRRQRERFSLEHAAAGLRTLYEDSRPSGDGRAV